MLKLKRIELELADNFKHKTPKKGLQNPYYKRWRLWCNGVYLGDIIKYTEKQKDGRSNYKIWPHKGDIGDIYHYKEFKYQKDAVDPRVFDGYGTLKEAYKAFVEQFKQNLMHYLEQ